MYPEDEDKDLDQWLAEQAAAAPVVAAAPAAAPEPSVQDPLRNVLDQLVAEGTRSTNDPDQKYLRDLWSKAESQSLQKLTGDRSAEDWAVGLGTALPMLAGVIADATTKNAYGVRGTGLGRIAEAGAQHAGQMLAQQQQRKQQAQGLAEAAAGIRRQGANTKFDQLSTLAGKLSEAERIRLAQSNFGVRANESQLKQEKREEEAQKFQFENDPNNPQALIVKSELASEGVPFDPNLSISGIRLLSPAISAKIERAMSKHRIGQAAAETWARGSAQTGVETATLPQRISNQNVFTRNTGGLTDVDRQNDALAKEVRGSGAATAVDLLRKLRDSVAEDGSIPGVTDPNASPSRALNTALGNLRRQFATPDGTEASNQQVFNQLTIAVYGALNDANPSPAQRAALEGQFNALRDPRTDADTKQAIFNAWIPMLEKKVPSTGERSATQQRAPSGQSAQRQPSAQSPGAASKWAKNKR